MYGQIRSLTYSPRSVATYRTWQESVVEYQLIFSGFVDNRELSIFQDEELQDIYETALTLNQKALDKLNGMSFLLRRLQNMDQEGESLYNTMQRDESLNPFFQEFQDISYYFTNTLEGYMNHFFTSFQKQSLRLERQLYFLFIVTSMVAGLVSILYSAMISREILRKISQVNFAFRKISRGDFRSNPVPSDGDELTDLLDNINELSLDLKDNINSILNLTRDMGEASEDGSSLDEILRLIAETVINDTASETAAVYSYDPLENSFNLRVCLGQDTLLVPSLSEKSYTGSTLLQGGRVTASPPDPGVLKDLLIERSVSSLLVLPLLRHDQISGFLLAMIHTKGQSFSDLGITRLINFSEYVSLTLINHRAYLELLEKREAEYNALQSQVQPHFIYNVLNGLIGLNRMGSKEKLEKAILSLREMLRYVTVQEKWTTLGQETSFLRSYCELQKIRFGNRLNYDFRIPEGLEDFRIPKLLLQPLVENSIIHGLEPLEDGGLLKLSAKIDHQENHRQVLLTLEDTGAGFDQKTKEQHVGLRNVKERLMMTYPGSEFLIRSAPGKGTSVLIIIVAEGDNP